MERGRFREILNEVAETYEKDKSHTGEDLSNFRMSERMGLPAWKGVLVMMGEKMGRLMNAARSENLEVESEALAKILTELATHSIVARMLLENPQSSIGGQDSIPRRGRRPGQRERKDAAEAADSRPEDTLSDTSQG